MSLDLRAQVPTEKRGVVDGESSFKHINYLER